jgi:hypothetical protein
MHGKERHPVFTKHLHMITQLVGHKLIISRALEAMHSSAADRAICA